MYDVKHAAKELFLEAADLQEIYEDFFTEAGAFLAACTAELRGGNFGEMRQAMHGLKGMAANLRMDELVRLARRAEEQIIRQDTSGLGDLLREIQDEILGLQKQIDGFYQG